ncbi:sensor histidine kinase [Oceaniglobus roseus]|uniref:sensor histidine kinase n=1 Tax=Oceaniglobus roseus TaxID=1737570 RepID=UPI000C7F3A17|nr:HAMP domain-containing sensor histidine kinase [Kandeliimicrobium roseum]
MSPTLTGLSLRARLGLGAGAIGLVAALAVWLAIFGMAQMAQRVDSALASEQRIQRYGRLASQVSTFLAVVYEAGQDRDRATSEYGAARLEGLAGDIRDTFALIRDDLDRTVEAEDAGFDERSRRASRSIAIARMEALFRDMANQFGAGQNAADPDALLGRLNAFSLGFDPLLNGVITEERRAREQTIAGIADLREWLTRVAYAVGALALLMAAGFHLLLVRPQMDRLARLQEAARRIGRADFAVALPETGLDEIGRLFRETNRMAGALAARQAEVETEWARLNQTIAEQTEALRSANAALAKTDEDRRRFFADVSHELRTPLTVILMETELALKGGAAPDGPFGVIEARARRLNRRIDDLLRVARSDSGTLSLQSLRFDLGTAVREAVEDMRAPAASAGVTLEVETAGEVPVTGDPNWTRQVIAGLVENGLRHARDGGRIAVLCDRTGDAGRVRVVDNGPGIAPADRARGMERFGQGPGDTRREGFGIGLALASWVVGQQGGSIALDSPVPAALRLGEATGTLVTVSLPLAEG